MKQAKGRDNHITECRNGNWSPEKVNAVSHLSSQFYFSVSICEGVILGEENLKHAFTPSLMLNKSNFQCSWNNTQKGISFRIVVHRFPSSALDS